MNTKENLHTGHRKRMIEKLFSSSHLPEHELLEILLYNCIPRKDTNEIAHRMIRKFGGIKGILSASPEELETVEGVGKSVSAYVKVLAQVLEKVYEANNQAPSKMYSFSQVREKLIELFHGELNEKFYVFLLNKKYEIITTLSYEDYHQDSVSGTISEITKALAINKPAYLIISHNHPSGDVTPSEVDDFTTAKINVLCNVHGVSFIDHVIVYKEKAYSYNLERRLEHIKRNYDIEKLFQKVSEGENDND